MTLREFCNLSILCKDDPIHLVSEDGSFMQIMDFNNECTVGIAEGYLRDEILDKEIACVTPSREAFVIYFKE